jgi:hypothetical protein
VSILTAGACSRFLGWQLAASPERACEQARPKRERAPALQISPQTRCPVILQLWDFDAPLRLEVLHLTAQPAASGGIRPRKVQGICTGRTFPSFRASSLLADAKNLRLRFCAIADDAGMLVVQRRSGRRRAGCKRKPLLFLKKAPISSHAHVGFAPASL